MLKGLIDNEGNWIDFDSISLTSPDNWGVGMYSIVCNIATHAIARKDYCDYSATELSVPVRRYWLEKRYDYWITPNQYADRWIGQTIHLGITDERPVYAELNGVIIGGTPDLVVNSAVVDYKATSVSIVKKIKKHGIEAAKTEWVEQLNVYRWLLNKNDVAIEKMFVVTILKSCFIAIDNHFNIIEVPVIDNIEALIAERIALIQAHKETPDIALPACDVDSVICENYCDVKEFCTFDDIEF